MSVELHVALAIGSAKHRVAIGLNGCREPLEEFDLAHPPAGLRDLFKCVRHHESIQGAKVCAAMEGLGGYARPLDTQVLAQGLRLYAVNNLKFARFKEIFPAPAKTDAIDARRMLQLMQMRGQVPMAEALLQEVAPVDALHQQLKALPGGVSNWWPSACAPASACRPSCTRQRPDCWRSPDKPTTCGFWAFLPARTICANSNQYANPPCYGYREWAPVMR